MKKVFLPLVGLCLISSSLYAAPYVFMEGGYSPMPTGQGGSQTFQLPVFDDFNVFSENFSNNETNSTPLLSAGIGWETPLNNSFINDNRIEFAYNQVWPTKTQGVRAQTLSDAPPTYYNYSYQAMSSQLYINDIIEFGAVLPKIHPFIGGGFGLGLNTTNDYREDNILEHGVFAGESGLSFLYTLTAGFSIHTNTPWTFFLGYRYINAGNASTDDYHSFNLPPDVTSDISLTTPININEIYFRMSYQL